MNKIRIMVDMSASLIHHGHVRLINKAASLGEVIIGLTSDQEIYEKKGFNPELNFFQRKEVLESFKSVSEVVETPWIIDKKVLRKFKIDFLVHGDDNENDLDDIHVKIFKRTSKISSSLLREKSLESLVNLSNQKLMLTPGPAAILHENIKGLKPVFGRGDNEYQKIEQEVSSWIKSLCGQDELVISQGSATFSIELALHSFVRGKILLISTGFYSDRLKVLLPSSVDLTICSYKELNEINENFDWILCAYTETSVAFKVDLKLVRKKADSCKAKLFLDATGSIGLEDNHDLADLTAFSSCKGLLGLTGASFIGFKNNLTPFDTNNFYFNLSTHQNKQVTGPYHAISSLHKIINHHEVFKKRICESKKLILETYEKLVRKENQPFLCTYIDGKVIALDEDVILYNPRSVLSGSVVCHLGEIHKDSLQINERIKIE